MASREKTFAPTFFAKNKPPDMHTCNTFRGESTEVAMNDAKANLLMEVCGNYAPLQYEAWSNGFELIEQSKDARIKELESLLKQLKEAA